jgi:hypothetical protein
MAKQQKKKLQEPVFVLLYSSKERSLRENELSESPSSERAEREEMTLMFTAVWQNVS